MLLKEPQSRFEEYYRIYEESFPSRERRTREQQRDILSHPCHRVRIREEDGRMEEDHPIPLWVMSYGKPVTKEEFEPYKNEIHEIAYGTADSGRFRPE